MVCRSSYSSSGHFLEASRGRMHHFRIPNMECNATFHFAGDAVLLDQCQVSRHSLIAIGGPAFAASPALSSVLALLCRIHRRSQESPYTAVVVVLYSPFLQEHSHQCDHLIVNLFHYYLHWIPPPHPTQIPCSTLGDHHSN